MWQNLAAYIFLGFLIAAVPGAVFFEVVRRTLSDRVSLAKYLLGNLTGMAVIILSVLLGFARLINDPLIANIFYVLCGVTLVILGTSSMLYKSSDVVNRPKSRYSAFTTGLFLSVLNPLGVVFWIVLVGKIVQETKDITQVATNIVGVVAGSTILFGVLIVFVSIFRLKITPGYLMALSRVFGFVILFYGILSFSKITL